MKKYIYLCWTKDGERFLDSQTPIKSENKNQIAWAKRQVGDSLFFMACINPSGGVQDETLYMSHADFIGYVARNLPNNALDFIIGKMRKFYTV